MADELKHADVSKFLAELLKVIKIVSVYPDDNPLPIKLKESFSGRFADAVRDSGPLTFLINRNNIVYEDEIVFEDKAKDESLAELFFNAGITEISFSPSFQYDECGEFFKIMKSFVNREAGAEDLVSLFWQARIPGFTYITLEDVQLNEYDGEFFVQTGDDKDDSFIRRGRRYTPDPEDDSGRIQYSSIFLDDDEVAEAAARGVGEEIPEKMPRGPVGGGATFVPGVGGLPAPQTLAEQRMGMNSIPSGKPETMPDTVQMLNDAFALSEADMARVEEMLADDANFDPFESTALLVREMLFRQTEYSEFTEVVTVVDKIQAEFIRLGNLPAAAKLFKYLRELESKLEKSQVRWKERINDAFVTAGGRERLDNLIRGLNNNSNIAEADLLEYLDIFGWEALSVIVDLLGVLEFRQHREAVCDYLVRAGRDHIDIISRGVFDRRWFVVRNSVSVLSRIGGEKAFSYVEKAIGHEDPRVRLQIARGLKDNDDEKSVSIMKQLVWDADEIVSQLAISSLLDASREDGFKIIAEIINDDRFATFSESTQEMFITTFSEVGGEYAVNYLMTLISGWGLFRTQVQEFYQRTAFRALSRNRSEKAEAALLKLSRSWRKSVRQKAKMAIKDRRAMIYGEVE